MIDELSISVLYDAHKMEVLTYLGLAVYLKYKK
jgi:hypothetical protein